MKISNFAKDLTKVKEYDVEITDVMVFPDQVVFFVKKKTGTKAKVILNVEELKKWLGV